MLSLLSLVLSNLLYFALHLGGGNSFPKPLSPKEENECLEKMESGDEQAKNKLVEHNLRLVAHVIKKYYSSGGEQEDLISIGTIGLIKGINNFKRSKGTRLATYCARCIENEILMHFRSQKKSSLDTYINDPIDVDSEGNPLTLNDILSVRDTIADDIDKNIKCSQLRGFVNDIRSGREREIITLRYGLSGDEPMTQRQVAQKLGISRSYVSRLEKKALSTLRKRFDG